MNMAEIATYKYHKTIW